MTAVTLQISSKVGSLNRKLIKQELEKFLHKNHLVDVHLHAFITKQQAKHRHLPRFDCALHITGKRELQVHAQGWGEHNMIKNTIKKATVLLHKRKREHKKMSYAKTREVMTRVAPFPRLFESGPLSPSWL